MNNENEPTICYNCGGTGMHPWKNGSCPICHGTGELTDEVFDDRYKRMVYRADHLCHDRV